MKRIFVTTVLCIATLISFAQSNSQSITNVKLIRSATFTMDYAGHKILVDPMFSPKGAFGSIAGKNKTPMVELPESIETIIKDVDLVLLTHNHPDHIDPYAIKSLDKSVKLFNQPADKEFLLKEGFKNAETIEASIVWKDITITRTNAQHGTGRVLKEMGPGSGYVLQALNLPTIYIVGDALWTEEIYQNIVKYKPDYIIVFSGGAAMPGFEATPIIMDESQTMSLIQESGNAKVIAVHMDAVDHCRTTRKVLRQKAKECNIGTDKLIIPKDGELVNL